MTSLLLYYFCLRPFINYKLPPINYQLSTINCQLSNAANLETCSTDKRQWIVGSVRDVKNKYIKWITSRPNTRLSSTSPLLYFSPRHKTKMDPTFLFFLTQNPFLLFSAEAPLKSRIITKHSRQSPKSSLTLTLKSLNTYLLINKWIRFVLFPTRPVNYLISNTHSNSSWFTILSLSFTTSFLLFSRLNSRSTQKSKTSNMLLILTETAETFQPLITR